jgi:L-ribulokinase
MDVSANKQDACVVGVDFGTLSGRALVVRVRDGEELGTAVHEYSHAVMDDTLAATGEQLPPDWALQDPEDYCDVLRHAVPAALSQAGIDPGLVIGIGTDFTASTVMPVLRRHPAVPAARTGRLPARLSQAVEASRCPAAGGPDQRPGTRARRTMDSRYGGKISAEWQFAKALQLLEEDPGSTSRPSGGSRRPTGSSGSCAATETRNACTAGYKGICRTGTTRRGSSSPRLTRGSPASPRTSWRIPSCRSAPGPGR